MGNATPRTGRRRAGSFRSTPTRRVTSRMPPWPQTDGDFVVVWESYGSYETDSDTDKEASRAALCFGRIVARRAVPGQHLHDALPVQCLRGGGFRRRFLVAWQSNGSTGRTRATSSSRATALRLGRFDTGCRVPGQHLYPVPPVSSLRRGDATELRRGVQSYGSSGRTPAATASRAAHESADRLGRRVPGQRLHEGFQRNASVTADAGGDFVVVWESYGSSGTDTSGFSIRGRRYASSGSPQARSSRSTPIRRATSNIPPSRRRRTGIRRGVEQRWLVRDGHQRRQHPGQRYASDGRRRAASSRSTPTRPASNTPPPWRRSTAASSWYGEARSPGRASTTRESLASATAWSPRCRRCRPLRDSRSAPRCCCSGPPTRRGAGSSASYPPLGSCFHLSATRGEEWGAFVGRCGSF